MKKRALTVNGKEYIMPKMDIDTYMDYLDIKDSMTNADASTGYTRQQFEDMVNFVCNAYGNQFTMDELKNRDTGLYASDIIMEFMLIDLNVGQEVSAKVDKLQKNFTSGK